MERNIVRAFINVSVDSLPVYYMYALYECENDKHD